MRAPFRFQRARRAGQPEAAGFTLVELMVAMTGGLFVALAVFALSRNAARFYQQENRIANATLSGVSGFERMASDLARAGHLVTPNINVDPHVCNRPDAAWPAMLRSLRAVLIETTSTPMATEVGDAGILPDGIVIAGALSTPEVLTTASVAQIGGGIWQVSLNTSTPAAARVGLSPSNAQTAANLGVMQSIFMPGGNGRIIRLRKKGVDQYAIASGVSTADGTVTALALINLAPTPQLVRPQSGGAQCGIEGLGENMDVSVIDLVRYDIRSMIGNASWAALYQASGIGGGASASPFDLRRAELVRVELDPAGVEIASTAEIVSEYATDLQVDAWAAASTADPTPVLVTTAVNNTYGSTQLIRNLHVRLSVRSREADREAQVSGLGGGTGDRYRFPVGGMMARARTFQTDISLRNLESSIW